MKVNKKKLSATILAAIMVLLVITMMPIGAVSTGRTYTDTGGEITIDTTEITPEPSGAVKVFIGEEMTFNVGTVDVDGPYDGEGNPKPGCGVSSGVSTWDTTIYTEGFYKVFAAGGEQGWATLDTQMIELELDPSATVVEEETVNLEIRTNKDAGVYEITIKDEEGYTVHKDAFVYYYTTELIYTIDTGPAGMDLEDGKYDICVKDKATEVDKSIRLTIKSEKLEVDAPDRAVLNKFVEIKIDSAYSKKPIRIYVKDCPPNALGWEWTPSDTGETERDGDWYVKWRSGANRKTDTGGYEFRVEIDVDNDGVYDEYEEFEIEVIEEGILKVSNNLVVVSTTDEVYVYDALNGGRWGSEIIENISMIEVSDNLVMVHSPTTVYVYDALNGGRWSSQTL